MPEFKDLPDEFRCPYRDGCPYLEGLSTSWVFHRYQEVAGTECQYEYQLEQLSKELDAERPQRREAELQNQQLQAQLQARHRRQFKSRQPAPTSECASTQRKQRGAPAGHPPWQRAKPTRIDQVVAVAAPRCCPHCHSHQLQPLEQLHDHVQEHIVLEPRTVVTCFRHGLAYCARCDKNVWLPGPRGMPGAYIGPAAKATATYLRYQLNVPEAPK